MTFLQCIRCNDCTIFNTIYHYPYYRKLCVSSKWAVQRETSKYQRYAYSATNLGTIEPLTSCCSGNNPYKPCWSQNQATLQATTLISTWIRLRCLLFHLAVAGRAGRTFQPKVHLTVVFTDSCPAIHPDWAHTRTQRDGKIPKLCTITRCSLEESIIGTSTRPTEWIVMISLLTTTEKAACSPEHGASMWDRVHKERVYNVSVKSSPLFIMFKGGVLLNTLPHLGYRGVFYHFA